MHKVLGLLSAAEADSAVLALSEKLLGQCCLFIPCPQLPSYPLFALFPFLHISLPQWVSLEDSLSSIKLPFYGK